MQHTIRVGVFNWTRFMSMVGFYPDDLPEDWHLSFYANEFESACISLNALAGQTDHFLDWVEDLDEAFQWSLYLDDLQQIDVLKSLCGKGLIPHWLIMDNQFSLMAEELTGEAIKNIGLDARRVIQVDEVWRPGRVETVSRVAILPGPEPVKTYRNWVEDWLQSLPAAHHGASLTLWLEAPGSDYQTLSECRTLVEMMGY